MNIEMIRAAAARLEGHARETPLLSSPFLDEIAGRRVLVKAECLQHTGSFKYRGARSALSALDPELRARGVIAFSSGNHAQGVARVAAEFGVPAVIVMPADAPALKIANTRDLGAEVVLYDRATEDRDAIGAALAAERGLTLVKPFDEPQVIAGQGTAGLEIARQARAAGVERADVLVCCGGGGLTSGIALTLAAEAPGLTVRPVEPEGFDDVRRSLESGRIERNDRLTGSVCDAIITPFSSTCPSSRSAARRAWGCTAPNSPSCRGPISPIPRCRPNITGACSNRPAIVRSCFARWMSAATSRCHTGECPKRKTRPWAGGRCGCCSIARPSFAPSFAPCSRRAPVAISG